MKYSDKIFDSIVNLLFELSEKGYQTYANRKYDVIHFEYRVTGIMSGTLTGNSSIERVEQLIKDLENLNK
jgi:hypothetical protein